MQSLHMPRQPAWLIDMLNGMARHSSGLGDPRQPEFSQGDSASGLFGLSRLASAYSSPRSASDALVLRILDEAASRRPPTELFDWRELEQTDVSNPSVAGAAPGMFGLGTSGNMPSRSQGGHLFAATFGSPERASEGSPMRANYWSPTDASGDRMSTAEWMRRRNDQLRQPELLAATAPAEPGQNGQPATDTVDRLEYWSEYRAPAGRSSSGGDQKALDLQAARAAGVENPGAVEIENPGAVFNDVDEAGRHIHPLMNRVSRSQNMEYRWAYYRDKATGKIGYTDPIATGSTGGAGISLYPFSSGRRFDLNSVDVTGTGHTHGDYSRRDRRTGRVVRTMRMYDEAGSDDFSRRQRQSEGSDYEYMRGTPRDWVHTLGTPSGRTWKWTHQRGRELLYERDP